MQDNESNESPKWDVALASLIRDEYSKKGKPLKIENFNNLATVHSIRFDDIMETVFKLCVHGEWCYQNIDGKEQKINSEDVEKLYVNARLYEKDVREFTGGWCPDIIG